MKRTHGVTINVLIAGSVVALTACGGEDASSNSQAKIASASTVVSDDTPPSAETETTNASGQTTDAPTETDAPDTTVADTTIPEPDGISDDEIRAGLDKFVEDGVLSDGEIAFLTDNAEQMDRIVAIAVETNTAEMSAADKAQTCDWDKSFLLGAAMADIEVGTPAADYVIGVVNLMYDTVCAETGEVTLVSDVVEAAESTMFWAGSYDDEWMHLATFTNTSDVGIVDVWGEVVFYNADDVRIGEGYFTLFAPAGETVEVVISADMATGQKPVRAEYEVGDDRVVPVDGEFSVDDISLSSDDWSTTATVTLSSTYDAEYSMSVHLVAWSGGLPVAQTMLYPEIPANGTVIEDAVFFDPETLPADAEIKAYIG